MIVMGLIRKVLTAALPAAAMLFAITSTTSASSTAPLLPINPTNWLGLAAAGVLLVIAAAAVVYILGGLIGSPDSRAWAKSQVIEGAISMALLLIFAFFIYLFYINPAPAFGPAGLVPSGCTAMPSGTVFSLAACDMFQFNQDAFSEAETMFVMAYFSGVTPGINIKARLPPPSLSGVSVSTGIDDFVPVAEEDMISAAFSGIFFALTLNQVQSLLLGGALLWLSLFLTIGLVARCFGFTRTFGGTMIALGLGLGLVYPLMVSIVYGFITTGIGNVSVAANIGYLIEIFITSLIPALLAGQFGVISLPIVFSSQFFTQLAYVITGLTFMPFLIFTILDAFIRDFSKAIGTQIDFMSLLGGLI